MKHPLTLFSSLSAILAATQQKRWISLKQLFTQLRSNQSFLLILFLTIPFCLPIQIPLISTPLGLIISYTAFRRLFGKAPWLPQKILNYKVSTQKIKKIAKKGRSLLKKIQFLLHPRLPKVARSKSVQKLSCLAIIFHGLFLSLPLPIPATNLIPGFSILLICLGFLEKDGLFVLLGLLLFILLILIGLTFLWSTTILLTP